jgi:hypothetical protein
MWKWIGFLLLVLPGALLAGSTNTAGGKEVAAELWYQNLSGTLAGNTSFLGGSARIVQKDQLAPGLSLTLKSLGSFTLDLSYTSLDLTTRFRSTPGFVFGGVNFGPGTDGTIDYKLPIFEAQARYIVADTDTFRLSTSAVLKLVDADVTLSSLTQTYHFDHFIPIPMLGVSGQYNFTNWLKFYGSYKFLDVDIGSVKTAVTDWEGGVIGDWNPAGLHTFRLVTGYRQLSVDLRSNPGKADEARIEVQHVGPFMELSSSF